MARELRSSGRQQEDGGQFSSTWRHPQNLMAWIRKLLPEDIIEVLDVYRDAVLSQARGLYSSRQIEAWAQHATESDGLRDALQRGYGMVSCDKDSVHTVEAFALLDPVDRLSLLYCRGRSARQGRGTALVQAVEQEALRLGCRRLRTEASRLSRPLLERQGWRVEAEETVLFAGESFLRWRMIKTLA